MTTPGVRPPAVAGQFYPGRVDEVQEALSRLDVGSPIPAEPAAGVMLPHAGWIYSGRTALRTIRSAELASTLLVLCPNHTGRGEPFAVSGDDGWEVPGGILPVDRALAKALLEGSTLLTEDTQAHVREHAIEVLLPLLAHGLGSFRFVPICVGSHRLDSLLKLGQEIENVLADWTTPVGWVVSSDMTHYESASAARDKDEMALEQVRRLDAAGLFETVAKHSISMCGVAPATVCLSGLAVRGSVSATLVDYTHSGQATGDDRQVVGYAGVRFSIAGTSH